MSSIDLVISGCDFSGTSTQVEGLIKRLKLSGKTVRDLRGTEEDAMFHIEKLKDYNQYHASFSELMTDPRVHPFMRANAQNDVGKILRMNSLRISSMIRNEISEYIDPESADFWIMEEPTHRGAGQTVRRFELYRSEFGDKVNEISASLAHQAYRSEEFLRFRKPIRDAGKNVIRSRSEESACYQLRDDEISPLGITREQYLSLPGHQIAFGNPPTHIFVVVGPADWNPVDYALLRGERSGSRILDDNEKRIHYQVMVNKRYATEWIDNLYEEACKMYGSKVPEITRFDIYHPKHMIMDEMAEKLHDIMKSSENP